MNVAKPYFVLDGYEFVAYPNRDSVPFREYYGIPEAETVIRGSLRYAANPAFVKALIDLGWLDTEPKEWLKTDLTWAQVFHKAIEADDPSERYVYPPSAFEIHHTNTLTNIPKTQHIMFPRERNLPFPHQSRKHPHPLRSPLDRPLLFQPRYYKRE